jgi:3-oxoadipate enol-lactonase
VELDSAKQIFHRQEIRPEALKKIQVPVLIVAGDEDQPSNIGGYRKLSEMIPHVTYKTIHHAGYTVMLEQSQELINVLRDFIERAEQHQKVSIKSRENRTFGPK